MSGPVPLVCGAFISNINSLRIWHEACFGLAVQANNLKEQAMKTRATKHGDIFHFGLAALAMIVPVLLVLAAGNLPDGERGELIVNGHELLLGFLAIALVLRAAYGRGVRKAHATLARDGASPAPGSRKAGSWTWEADRRRAHESSAR